MIGTVKNAVRLQPKGAVALTDRGARPLTTSWRQERLAFDAILKLPSSEPVVMTGGVASGGSSDFLVDNWRAILALAERRKCGVYSIVLSCSEKENVRRMGNEAREVHRKKRKPESLAELLRTRQQLNDGATASIEIHNTDLSPEACADAIVAWLREIAPSDKPEAGNQVL